MRLGGVMGNGGGNRDLGRIREESCQRNATLINLRSEHALDIGGISSKFMYHRSLNILELCVSCTSCFFQPPCTKQLE